MQQLVKICVASESFLKTQWSLLKQYPDILLRVTLEPGGESQIAGFSVQRQITALPRHLHAENLNKNEWIGCSPVVTVKAVPCVSHSDARNLTC